MALSGQKTFTLTRDEIINAAFRKIGEYDSNDSATPEELSDAQLALNALVKEWNAEGVGYWLNQRTVLILNQSTQQYALGPSGTTGTTDNFHAFRDSELVETSLIADAAASQAVIEATGTSWVDFDGLSATKPGANTWSIGVRLDSGAIHWAIWDSDAANSVTLDSNLPSAASSGNKVYAYTTLNRTDRPTGIIKAYRRDTSGVDTPVFLQTRQQYESQSLKTASGPPTEIHYAPELTDAALYVWPSSNPMTVDKLVMITTFYSDDFTAAGDNMEFPSEWANALIWNLADELAEEYELDHDKALRVAQRAGQKKEALFTIAMEDAEVRFGIGEQWIYP
jgi:hypothetical protein